MSHMPGSVKDFLEWAKTKDPNERYWYYNTQNCACAQYCRDRGLDYSTRKYEELEKIAGGATFIDEETRSVATFGELVQEAEDFLVRGPRWQPAIVVAAAV